MSHFAKVVDGKVMQVIVAEQEIIDTFSDKELWIQTSYGTIGNKHRDGKTPLRANYASPGSIYDKVNDVFYAPQPYPSWILNITTYIWEPPVPLPKDNKPWIWNESSLKWDPIP